MSRYRRRAALPATVRILVTAGAHSRGVGPRGPTPAGRQRGRGHALAGVVMAAVAGCGSGMNSVGSGGASGSGAGPGTGGGASATGGTIGTGGSTATGGVSATGGANATGGAPGRGGAFATGGTTATGGIAGPGGSSGSGGSPVAGRGGSAGRGGPAGPGGRAGGATGGFAGSGSTGLGGAAGRAPCPGGPFDAASPPTTATLSGNLGAHDPAALVEGAKIYLFATGLIAKTSTNLTSWQAATNPLSPLPAWVAQQVPGATNLWAPDISHFGGAYHLYYAASTFGSNKSCIGHATRAALDSGAWVDQGTTICSNMGQSDNWNAIDPNVIVDDAGIPWLAFGSFWGGLKMIRLDAATGARADTMLYSIAARPKDGGALEGPWVFKRCGYYYLFSSFDSCCSDKYDYNIRVGRSSSVTGPYVDKAGVELMQGGGTLLVAGDSAWIAPGHNAVVTYGDRTYNIYHALTAKGMTATLRISELVWDADGWPVSAGP
jgi:arabinan endo-1,5-alpha-L-arabinosidase